MNGGDHINEKLATSDLASQRAFYEHASVANGNSLLGAIRTGSERTEGTINFDAMKSHALSSAFNESKSAVNTLNETYSNAWTSSTSAADQASVSRTLGSRMMANGSQSVQSLAQGVRQTAWGKQLSDAQMSQVVDTVSAGLSAGWSVPQIIQSLSGLKLGASTSSGTQESDSSSRQEALTQADQKALANTFQSVNTSDLTKAREAALTQTDASTFLTEAGVSENSTIGRAATGTIEKTRNFQEARIVAESIGLTGTYSTRQVAAMLDNDAGNVMMGRITTAYQNSGIGREAEAVAQRLVTFNGMDEKSARTAGYITALGKSSEHRDQQNLATLLQTATGLRIDGTGDAASHRGVAGDVREARADGLRAEGMTRTMADRAEARVFDEQAAIGSHLGSAPNTIDRAEDTVRTQSILETANGPLAAQARRNSTSDAKAVTKARENLKSTPPDIAEIPRSFMGSQREASLQA